VVLEKSKNFGIEYKAVSAGIAQLVERNLAKVEVASSSLVSRSKFKKGSFGFLFSWAQVFLPAVLRHLKNSENTDAASVVKLVDTADLKSAANGRRHTGSIPVRGTIYRELPHEPVQPPF
jgi:hypothetical protein